MHDALEFALGMKHVEPVLRKNITRPYATLWVLNLLAGSAASF